MEEFSTAKRFGFLPIGPRTYFIPARSYLRGLPGRGRSGGWRVIQSVLLRFAVCLVGICLATSTGAQTITVVGTRHLTGMEQSPSREQFRHTVEALSAFNPTQVCVERMSGERIEAQLADPQQHGMTFQPDTHGRPLASVIVPLGMELQFMLEYRPTDARKEAGKLLTRGEALSSDDRIRAIGLLIAGFEFHSAVLNWSYLDDAEREGAGDVLGSGVVDALDEALESVHEAYSLGVPLARKAGLHELCTADSLEDESRGMAAAIQLGGMQVLESPQVQARFDELHEMWDAQWQPDSGPSALTRMLHYFNSDEFAEADRRLQWETLREFDNRAGAFHRRLLYWHARTAEISAELFRALARGAEERVLFIVGSSHRPFTEADLRAQPWIEVEPASSLLGSE